MTDISYKNASNDVIEDLDDPVAMEKEELEALRDKASRADELEGKLEDVNTSIEQLAESTKKMEDVDDSDIEELRDSEDPVILESGEYEELSGMVDEVSEMFAEELEEHSPFSAEELQENFSPSELREKVEDHEEASVAEELSSTSDPEPEGGSKTPEELSGRTDGDEDIPEEELRETVAEELEASGMQRPADKVRSGEIGLDELGIDIE